MTKDFGTDLIRSFDTGYYFDLKGNPVTGLAVSLALSEMRYKGWENLGNLNDFETKCENRHFTIIPGKNIRGQSCRIVCV